MNTETDDMGDFVNEGERAARGWQLAARLAPGALSPLRVEIAGQRLLLFHGLRREPVSSAEPGGVAEIDTVLACVVAERCPACEASRASARAWTADGDGPVRCPACGGEESVAGGAPAWPVMCVDDEVYVYAAGSEGTADER